MGVMKAELEQDMELQKRTPKNKPSILQDWVSTLGLRHQGVVVTCLRGCDGFQKEDPSKQLLREIRGILLTPYDARELKITETSFMSTFPSVTCRESFPVLLKSLDGYPVHFITHLIFACEIIGYHHPDTQIRLCYEWRYKELVKKLHFKPESKEEMDARLCEDRVANGTVNE